MPSIPNKNLMHDLSVDNRKCWDATVGIASLATSSIYINWNTGDDKNSGTALAPIKSHKELARRISHNPITSNLTITHQVYPPIGADPLRLDLDLQQMNPSGPLQIVFQAPALTVKKSGTLGAITTRVRSTNTPWNVTKNNPGTQDFDSTDVGLRLFIPSGARAGSRSAVAKILSATNVRTSGWAVPDTTNLINTFTTPQAGDPYQVLQAPGQLEIDYVRCRGQAIGSLASAPPYDFVAFRDYDFAVASQSSSAFAGHFHREGLNAVFTNCRFSDSVPAGFTRTWVFTGLPFSIDAYNTFGYQQSCIFTNLTFWREMPPNGDFADACLFLAGLACDFGGILVLAGETIVQSTGVADAAVFAHQHGSMLTIEDCGVFDWPASSFFNGGLIVEREARARVASAFYGLQGLWGSSSVANTTGAQITDRSRLAYSDSTKFYIKGATDPAGGGYQLCGRTTAAAYDTATGLNTEGVPTSWAALSGAGKDNMHDWPHDAHVYKEFNIG